MSYDVIATPRFKRDIKKLVKKYLSLKKEYAQLISELEENPNHKEHHWETIVTKYAYLLHPKGKANREVQG